ncbi:hypothetical protein [Shinella sp.]|uniref:hypothetical protein n=1 Tax=Shinella sp. TaxID=1870904 RepID=UPI003F71D704
MTGSFFHHNDNPVAANAATDPRQIVVHGSTLVFTNRHAGISLKSFEPFQDSETLRMTADCEALFQSVRDSGEPGRFVFGRSPDDLYKRDARMVAAIWDTQIVGTLHFHRDTPNRLTLRGAAVDPAFSGQRICSAMGAAAMLHDVLIHGPFAEVACAIRQLPDGTLNEPSKISFGRLGLMLEAAIATTYLEGNYRDRHLFATSEIDHQGAFIRYRRMIAGPETFLRARAFLAPWSDAVLPLPKRVRD